LKNRTVLIVLLAFSVGTLYAVASATPMVQAQGGVVYGVVYWTDMYGDMRPMAWGVQVTADDGANPTVLAYTTNGTYAMWLPEGTYEVTASAPPGFFPQTYSNIIVSPGSSTPLDFTLEATGEPVPELPPWAQPLILLSAMMVVVLAVRRYRIRPRH